MKNIIITLVLVLLSIYAFADINDDLYETVGNGDVEKWQRLITHGADVNFKDDDGWTALMYAVFGRTEVAELLIQVGADVNAKYRYCKTDIERASYWGYKEVVQLFLDAGAVD